MNIISVLFTLIYSNFLNNHIIFIIFYHIVNNEEKGTILIVNKKRQCKVVPNSSFDGIPNLI